MNKYDKIINKKYKKNYDRKNLTMYERASQFASFQALKGFENEIKEVEKILNDRVILSNEKKQNINNLLNILNNNKQNNLIKIKYFEKEINNEKGNYKVIVNKIKKIDEYNCIITLIDNTKIKMTDISDIEIIQ